MIGTRQTKNISDADAQELTDFSTTNLHTHDAGNITNFDNEVDLNPTVTQNTIHRTSSGADHGFINQDVTTTATPTFSNISSTNNATLGAHTPRLDQINGLVSANPDVVANTAKVSADGSINTHSDVDTATVAPTANDLLRYDGSDWVPASNVTVGVGVVGEVVAYAQNAIPADFLECNAAPVSRVTYSALFAVIGTTYGAGDGSTTFNLPELRGRFIRGHNSSGSGQDPSRTFGSAQVDSLQGHSHSPRITGAPVYSAASSGSGANNVINDNDRSIGGAQWLSSGPEDNGFGIPRTASETRPYNLAMKYCIRYQKTTETVSIS